ncbi:GNAT family N-acetyltransferase [Candidatus Kaiserbacteria bacterium]|nr:GNAT family N-acetyltransferase [Candidatus Kaiserbacteria bacterium]
MERISEDISFRLATLADLSAYTDLLQRTYESAYVHETIGLAKEHFSKEIFNNDDTQNYLRSKLEQKENQRTWLAEAGGTLVGAVTITDKGEECELSGFYVAPQHQRKGVGRALWERALEFSTGKDIALDLYAHNQNAIEMYERWGFEIDTTKGDNGVFYRHWPEWPESLQAKAYYMRRRGKATSVR